jgi:vacuolar-type H+-ATPase subunit H
MVQEVVSEVLAIERAALAMQAEAQVDAERLVAEAGVAAAALRARSREEASQAAAQQSAADKAAADAECARILDEARAEAERFERQAEARMDEAIAHVVARVAGRRAQRG